MGWFWADSPLRVTPIAPHPVPQAGQTPPPGCPMHKSDSQPTPFPPRLDAPEKQTSSCPVKSPSHPLRYPTSPTAPQSSASSVKDSTTTTSSSTLSKLNPLNYMPSLPNTRSEDSPQNVNLPLQRETSSIPRGDAESNWEYPSPQQMYNAMLRKGYTDTPTDAVESMVAVHNFLNEGAWKEILEWESIFGKGLSQGWQVCKTGEQGIARERAKQEFLRQRREARGLKTPQKDDESRPRLLRFMGRPGEPTPKARMMGIMGYWFPERFGTEPPFDRHDWYISRKLPNGTTKEVRYVIDYYAGGAQETGEPVFYLDIRPALDTPSAALERTMRWGGDIWYRASGAGAKE